MFTRHKKHQIIFVRRGLARDNTQLTQGLPTPFDWKCLTRYSSSLIVKITTCSAFTKKTSVRILTARHRSYVHKKFKGSYGNQTGIL